MTGAFGRFPIAGQDSRGSSRVPRGVEEMRNHELTPDSDRPDFARALPVGVTWRDGQLLMRWCDFHDLAFTDPFFFDTYERLIETRPGAVGWETDGRALLERAESADALPVAGFILHMGRCGSTLVSRLLSTSDRLLVMSEPDAMVGLLDFPPTVPADRRPDWFRAMVQVLAQRRRHTETAFVLKLTSFHVLHLDLIAEAFPTAPWVFLVRDPDAVVRSVMTQPTGLTFLQETPESIAPYLGMSAAAVTALSRKEFLARSLAQMLAVPLSRAADVRARRAIVVAYPSLPAAVWERIAPFLGLSPTEGERSAMERLARLYSKDPSGTRPFRAGADGSQERMLGVDAATLELLIRRYRDILALT